nr:MAG TPA: hypothetical protein [Caudoviricetes sp.]
MPAHTHTHLRSGRAAPPAPRKCDDTHGRKSHFDLRPPPGDVV